MTQNAHSDVRIVLTASNNLCQINRLFNGTLIASSKNDLACGGNTSPFTKRALFWAPRVLSIAFIAFLSLFALDVLDEPLGFWQTAFALTIHLIPSFVLIAVLILAWRWEWIGAALYAAAGLFYVWMVMDMARPISLVIRLPRILPISGPTFIIAWLFLANWLKRDEINEPGKYLRRSKESVKAELPIPPKGGNTILMPWLMLEVMVVLAAVFVFVICVISAWDAASAGVSLGMSMAMYLVTRAAAFVGILAFLHFGVRACLAGIDRSRGWVQWMGWVILILTVIVLTLVAFMILIFFSLANY